MNYFEREKFSSEELELYPELVLNSKEPFEVHVGIRNEHLIEETIKIMPAGLNDEGQVLGYSINAFGYLSKVASEGLNQIIVAKPGLTTAMELNSPIIGRVKNNLASEDWTKKQEELFYESLGGNYTRYPFGYHVADILNSAGVDTGVDSFQLISNHSIVVYSAIAEFMNEGGFVGMYNNNDRTFTLFPDVLYPSDIPKPQRMSTFANLRDVIELPELPLF